MSAAARPGSAYAAPCAEHTKMLAQRRPLPWEEGIPVVALVARDLLANHFAVFDGFVGSDEARVLRDELKQLYSDGRMVDGEIGSTQNDAKGSVRHEFRTDKVVWLEGSEQFVGPMLKRHILRMDIFSQRLSILLEAIAPEESWTGNGRSKIMCTVYPGSGARYVAHYDNPNSNGRKVTTILYLNEGWKESDGGVLRVQANGKSADVAPLFDRLLVFWSDKRCPHEVLPATGPDRFAVTIWFLDQTERDEAAKRIREAVAAKRASDDAKA